MTSHDGTMLASSGGYEDAVRLWEPKSGRLTQELPKAAWYNALAWSPDGPRLALKIMDQSVLVRDVTGKSADLLIVEGNSGGLECIAWSPDGRTVATGNHNTNLVNLWDTRTGSRVQTIAGCSEMNLAVSAGGHYCGTPGIEDELVYVVQSEKGQETLTPQEYATRYGWINNPEGVRFDR